MARRRSLTGRPLLVATVGVVMTAAGCNGAVAVPPPGNLMPPPMIQAGELCVDTVPEDALVTVDGVAVEPRCTTLGPDYEGRPVAVHVSAPGFVAKDETVPLGAKMAITVTLAPDAPLPPPVGNLMPPPPPPPVGNLIAPPPIDPPKPK